MNTINSRTRAATRSLADSHKVWSWLLVSTVLLVGLVLSTGQARAAIHASLERPASNFPASGVGNVQGWAFTDVPNASIERLIEVQIDNESPFYVPCCSGRGDVQDVYPNAPIGSGYSGAYNFQRLDTGLHDIRVTIRSTAGESKTIVSTFEVVKLSPFKFLRSFSWSDIQDPGCESVNGMDPAYGNAGAVCIGGKAVSKSTGNPTSTCDGTIQFAFDRASQTLMPISGCDPQGTLGGDNGGGDNGGGNSGGGGLFTPGHNGNNGLELTCFKNAVYNLKVTVDGLTPTFSFDSKYKAEAGFEVWKLSDFAAGVQAVGNGPRTMQHAIKPLPFVSKLEQNTEYFYRLRVKSSCPKYSDVVREGTFRTEKRYARAYIDRVYVVSDGDGGAAGIGELRYRTAFFHSSLSGGIKSNMRHQESHDNTAFNDVVSTTWAGAAEDFTVGFLAGEFDPPQSGPEAEKKIAFSTSLTLPGGTWTDTFTLQDDNMKVTIHARVVVWYQ